MLLQESLNDVTKKSISVLDLMFSGGTSGTFIIIILFLLMGISIYVYVERLLHIRNAQSLNRDFISDIENSLKDEDFNKVISECDYSFSPLSNIVRKVIINRALPFDYVNSSAEETVAREVHLMEKNINILATISGSGPMIGFLGTVVGMILSFYSISQSGGQADMSIIASGIYTAMTTTVAGLLVGIMAHLGYNHLVTKNQTVLHEMQLTVNEIIERYVIKGEV